MKTAMVWGLPLLCFAACAVLLFVVSGMEFSKLRAYADGMASDGVAESFTKHIHGNLVERAHVVAIGAGVLALLWGGLRKLILQFVGQLVEERATFRKDSARTHHKLKKFTSKGHKRAVFALIICGTLLRAFFLMEPITYDEAFTYVHYISKPLSVLLSDYSYPNNHIFHNLIAKVFTSIFGGGVLPLRLTAFLFGVLTMPLVYVLVRAMFNRYIAITTLALMASAGGFVEYSAIARGYSITWVCFVAALLLGRYFIKKNNLYVMLLLGLVNAIGFWAVPVMIYPALAVYMWILISVVLKFQRSLNERVYKILGSLLTMAVFSALFYLPVIITYGVGQLFSHPTMGDTSWSAFMAQDHEQIFAIWVYLTHFSQAWIILTLLACALFSIVVSSKFRAMVIGAVVVIVPMVLIQSVIGPPRIWNFLMLYLYISGGIGIYYFLKFVQSKAVKNLAKRARTIASCIIIFAGCGYLTSLGMPDRIFRMAEVKDIGRYFSFILKEGDRVIVDFPIEAPVEYHFLLEGVDTGQLYYEPEKDAVVYVLVNSKKEQSLTEVIEARSEPEYFEEAVFIEEKGHTSIYKTKLK